MRAALRNGQRSAISATELNAYPLLVSRRIGAKIDRDIEKRALSAANRLRLLVWWQLKMQSSETAPLYGEAYVYLRYARIEEVRFTLLLTPRASEEPPVIFVSFRLSDPNAVYFCLVEQHLCNRALLLSVNGFF
jgi:hypothetical protein